MSVRVRYAPSPTGMQHIGGVRTALFNYLFARANAGAFVLRVEDTDRERFSETALQDIYDTFDWLGFRWDEGPDCGGPFGPYIQSQRLDVYRAYAEQLVAAGHAYRCFCSADRLEELRRQQAAAKRDFGYDRHCRDLPADEAERLAGRQPSVIRFKVPLTGSTTTQDLLLGAIERKHIDVNPDPVIIKSDGYPTYHLANVVDDHLMQITHILRAQEWIPSASLHALLYGAFGWPIPTYCHLPMVMGQDGKKLSKRHGATSVIEFRRAGYLPEALINYISLLGWSLDDVREVFALAELAEVFSLDRLHKAPAVFDYQKLDWFNGHYIRLMNDRELTTAVLPILVDAALVANPPTDADRRLVAAAMPIAKERLKVLPDICNVIGFLFRSVEPAAADLVPKKQTPARTRSILAAVGPAVETVFAAGDEECEAVFKEFARLNEVKLGDVLMPLRVAVTGSRVSPPLFASMRLLGKNEVIARIETARSLLETIH